MIRIIALSSLMGLLVSSAYAEDASKNKANFETAKQKVVQKIDERIVQLNDAKKCILQSQDHKEIKKCRPKKEKSS